MNKIIYLDAAASSLKPASVIDAEMRFLRDGYANAGRGVCARAVAADDMVMQARNSVAAFINADATQIVFTSGATDGLNRVVDLSRQMVRVARPVVCVSDLDHHSARLPWQNLAANGAAEIVVAPLDADFNIDVARVPYSDIMVITAMSNVMGVPQDVAAIIRAAREKNPNVVTIVDSAQYVAHDDIDVKAWGCDFMCFSGHKMGADTGIGVMYIRNSASLQPDVFGGGMVLRVDGDKIIPNAAPDKFEAGTLPLTQIAGLVPAIDYLSHNRPDSKLIQFLYDELSKMSRIKILTGRDACMLTFVVDGMHVLDFGALVGARGVCLRVGNMCATWIHRLLGVPGSIRLSPGAWNTMDEMHQVVDIIKSVVK
ncbi:MAG: aminotransferase class V-fold PLP-dependent enzyme [Alphaproteobacteria bacterium]|nr:aminotransferase class V-fold PLP-dependent enzyme [Alphaproteobacteria bacterium]